MFIHRFIVLTHGASVCFFWALAVIVGSRLAPYGLGWLMAVLPVLWLIVVHRYIAWQVSDIARNLAYVLGLGVHAPFRPIPESRMLRAAIWLSPLAAPARASGYLASEVTGDSANAVLADGLAPMTRQPKV